MIHQITLLGGQVLPIYWGILEKKPNEIHVLYTKETRHFLVFLKNEFVQTKFHTYQVEPYDFIGIKDLVTDIILGNDEVTFQLNLTSGTKVMALACQSVVSELEHEVFYIDQKHRIIDISDAKTYPLQSNIKIKTFFALTGHKNFTFSQYSSFTVEEKLLAQKVFELSQIKSGIQKLFENVRNNCEKIESLKDFQLIKDFASVQWKNSFLQIQINESTITCNSPRAFKIVFGGLWWEMVVADVTSKWSRSIEQLLGVSISTKDHIQAKNEIDIILNTGKNLIFVECKSGNVNQSDLNKIKSVNKLYGGISSKSILVCRFIPRKDLLEKCKDFGIEVFAFQASHSTNSNGKFTGFRNLNDLLKKLDLLINRLEIE